MDPIEQLVTSIMGEKKDVYTKMLEKLNVQIPKDAKDLITKPLLKVCYYGILFLFIFRMSLLLYYYCCKI